MMSIKVFLLNQRHHNVLKKFSKNAEYFPNSLTVSSRDLKFGTVRSYSLTQ